MEKDDQKLILEFLDGDKKGFEILINRYLKSVYNFVFRMVGDQSQTEDIIQDSFIKLWKNIKKIDPKQNFKTWLFTIARNTTIDYFRKRKNIAFSQLDSKIDQENGESEKSFTENIADLEPLPNELFMQKELGQELERALAKIRIDFREVILLHYMDGLTFEEISAIVQKPLNTVKSHHHRALTSLRKFISTSATK
jgi:RNA polymerase sigma-70 factor, ECF subfamily